MLDPLVVDSCAPRKQREPVGARTSRGAGATRRSGIAARGSARLRVPDPDRAETAGESTPFDRDEWSAPEVPPEQGNGGVVAQKPSHSRGSESLTRHASRPRQAVNASQLLQPGCGAWCRLAFMEKWELRTAPRKAPGDD